MTVRQFHDLVATAALAPLPVLALLALGPSPVTLALALPLLLLLPGYVVTSALYPRADALGGVARFALAIALSVAITPGVAFAANYTVGVYPLPILVGVASVTVSLAIVAAGRRSAVPEDDRAGPAPGARAATIADRYFHGTRSLRSTAPLEATTGFGVFLNLVIVAAILVFAASVGFAALVPQGEGVTEAYLATTADGNVTLVQDPAGLSAEQRGSLVTVVNNEEGHRVKYTVVVVAQDVSRTDDGVQVDGERVLDRQTGTLDSGDTWHVPVPASDGDRTVVRVYKGAAEGEAAYRLVLEEP